MYAIEQQMQAESLALLTEQSINRSAEFFQSYDLSGEGNGLPSL